PEVPNGRCPKSSSQRRSVRLRAAWPVARCQSFPEHSQLDAAAAQKARAERAAVRWRSDTAPFAGSTVAARIPAASPQEIPRPHLAGSGLSIAPSAETTPEGLWAGPLGLPPSSTRARGAEMRRILPGSLWQPRPCTNRQRLLSRVSALQVNR